MTDDVVHEAPAPPDTPPVDADNSRHDDDFIAEQINHITSKGAIKETRPTLGRLPDGVPRFVGSGTAFVPVHGDAEAKVMAQVTGAPLLAAEEKRSELEVRPELEAT